MIIPGSISRALTSLIAVAAIPGRLGSASENSPIDSSLACALQPESNTIDNTLAISSDGTRVDGSNFELKPDKTHLLSP